jgi:hypothetical protein
MTLPVSLHLMPHLSITRLYELLPAKLVKEPAENLTTFIEENITKRVGKQISNTGQQSGRFNPQYEN